MKDKLLILGVDPGAKVGYVIMDLDGNVIKSASRKNLSYESLIKITLNYGRVVVVGSDVSPASSYVKKISTMLGAMLAQPEDDIWTKHKNEMVKGYVLKDTHQKDAMVAAIVALNHVKPVLNKIRRILKKKNKLNKENEVVKLTLTKRHLSVDRAVRMLEVD